MTARVAVVTGGASGIGEGVARRFVADGHRVAVLDRDAARAAAVAAELRAAGGDGIAVEVDVADWDSVDAAFARVRRELGPVGILVTSAASSRSTRSRTSTARRGAASSA